MLTSFGTLILGVSLLSSVAIWRLYQIRRAFGHFSRFPTYSTLVSPVYPLGRTLPRIPWVAPGSNFGWRNVYESMFGKVGSDIVVLRSLSPLPRPYLLIADATALKAIYQDHSAFPKPMLNLKYGKRGGFGPNLVSSEHEEWRKHRRIAGPSFSEKNIRLVWESSIEVILGYFNKWNRDGKGRIVKVDNFTEVTTQIAYMVFTMASFGISADWDAGREVLAPGHSMPFMEALKVSSEALMLRSAVPRWLLSLSQHGRRAIRGFTEIEQYMLEMIEERKSSAVSDEKRDLMSNWIHASMAGEKLVGKEPTLNQRDILGNIFVFLVAGHETTAYSLAFALALLSIYQDEQEELHNHIRSVVPEGRLPTYEDVPHLTRVIAVISETLRLYPPVSLVLKEAAEDCVIPTSNGESIAVPKGTGLVPMIDAIHHNEKYWPDPHEFRPNRFLGDYNKDAFIPFSTGARACIGRRFSEIEQIAVLSVVVLHYKITVLEEPQYAFETSEERKARVLQRHRPFLVKPVRVPLVFTPREGTDIQGC